MNGQEIKALDERYVLHTYARAPFVIERGEGVRVYDTEGKGYLDFVSGIAVNALGYGDPDVLAAVAEQSQQLMHISNLYHTVPQAQLAQMLVERSFADKVFFCNSGTEAVEAALKFARKWAKRNHADQKTRFVAFEGAFHGRTMGALSLTPRPSYQDPFRPLIPGAAFGAYNDLASAEALIDDDTCACIVEPVQGEGGVYPADPAFLKRLRELCDRHGALLIFDEVQCGMGAPARCGPRAVRRDARSHDPGQAPGRRAAHRRHADDGRGGERHRAGRPWQHLCRQPRGVRRGAGGDDQDRRARVPRARAGHGLPTSRNRSSSCSIATPASRKCVGAA